MTTLLIAIGNTLRRDDGVAHRVLELLTPLPVETVGCPVHQLTPELVADIARFDHVVFLDAQRGADEPLGSPALEPLAAEPGPLSVLGHTMSPAAMVALAGRLYDFTGQAWLLPIPVHDFDLGEGLSPEAESSAQSAASQLREWLLGQ